VVYYFTESQALVLTVTHLLTHSPNHLLTHSGKTLIARAVAKECQAAFIYIQSSDIFDKFLGESEKRVTAIFSLADKLAPSIIFIDELETCLAKRGVGINSDLTNNVLGRFLSAWDGLLERTKPVVVLGATNRPEQLDPAVLRRLPIKLATKVPDLGGRIVILQKLFKNELPLEGGTHCHSPTYSLT
jgi:SpoVK/Ycf46/Vps4 family AAA+-type ATPase